MAVAKPNELRIVREYDAPVQLVWDAWTDPEQVAQWWGPRGFTLTHHSKDLRPGGHWHYTMHGPDGTDYENRAAYLEVEPLKKLVYDHGGNHDRPALFRVTAIFTEKNGKTTLDMTMALATPEAAKEIKKFIKAAGGNGTWDRLGEFVTKRTRGVETFVIARSFAAPIETVFDMWTNPKHLSRWLPPTGFQMQILRGRIAAGESVFYKMSNDAGVTLYGTIEYLTIDRPHRIADIQRFCDQHGNEGRHPLLPTWPGAMNLTVTFTDEGDGETRVRVEWQPSTASTPQEIAAFVQHRPSMTGGWTGSFDKLEELLASNA
jgi:uncharacterized protein YndB with AHSA1/START domain